MQYKINNVPLENYGFRPGWLAKKESSFALSGMFNLPERIGNTYYQWPTGIEPFISPGEIQFGTRQLALSLVCKADSLTAFKGYLNAVYTALSRPVILSTELLGEFQVIAEKSSVKHYKNGWAAVILYLKEEHPTLANLVLPKASGAAVGIDGYSWEELGMVVSSISGRYNLGRYNEAGVRDFTTLPLKATLKAPTLEQFKLIAQRLQVLFSRPGVRRLKYFDGTQEDVFAVAGFKIEKIREYSGRIWGDFEISLIVC
ncbi:MAG: hypothetical protein RRY35_02050 [Clostridiales bacterium]